jgi:hypothetical protein
VFVEEIPRQAALNVMERSTNRSPPSRIKPDQAVHDIQEQIAGGTACLPGRLPAMRILLPRSTPAGIFIFSLPLAIPAESDLLFSTLMPHPEK